MNHVQYPKAIVGKKKKKKINVVQAVALKIWMWIKESDGQNKGNMKEKNNNQLNVGGIFGLSGGHLIAN